MQYKMHAVTSQYDEDCVYSGMKCLGGLATMVGKYKSDILTFMALKMKADVSSHRMLNAKQIVVFLGKNIIEIWKNTVQNT